MLVLQVGLCSCVPYCMSMNVPVPLHHTIGPVQKTWQSLAKGFHSIFLHTHWRGQRVLVHTDKLWRSQESETHKRPPKERDVKAVLPQTQFTPSGPLLSDEPGFAHITQTIRFVYRRLFPSKTLSIASRLENPSLGEMSFVLYNRVSDFCDLRARHHVYLSHSHCF